MFLVRRRVLLCAWGVAAALAAAGVARADAPIPPDEAHAAFLAAARSCAADGGRLWGVSLCGPLLFVDPATHAFVANVRDSLGVGRPQAGVFVGTLPNDQNVANTSVSWGGVRWTEVAWPLPPAGPDRDVLLAHEMFHRIQPELGIAGGLPANAHLDSADGRTWLRLEWRALAAALRAARGSARTRAVGDALAFRAARRARFATAAAEECSLERFEGLAEYTGITVAIAAPADRVTYALGDIARQEASPTLVRSFAYASGPAYGLLLDASGVPWRQQARQGADLGTLLAGALALEPSAEGPEALAARAAAYDGAALEAEEHSRADRKQAALAAYRRQLVDGPTLRIALANMNIQFDPHDVQPLGDAGTVYPHLRITDDWGVLTVTGGALVAPDWRSVVVAAPADGATHGDGWQLELKAGWKLVPTHVAGSFTLAH